MKTLKTRNKWIKPLLTIVLLFYLSYTEAQTPGATYKVENGDSTLTDEFVKELCKAARFPYENPAGGLSKLEELLLTATGTSYHDSLSGYKTNRWYEKYGVNINCVSTGNFPEGNFLRQVVHSNYRDFANLIGPRRPFELNILKKTGADSLSLYAYTNEHRKKLEARHDNRRFEFQQDEEWRNIMFFYFLFSEYKINYEQNLEK